MNSYPPELLAQLAPVMFVAGLGTPPPPTSPQSPAPKPQDPFSVLALRLKDVLQSQRRPAVWQPDRSKTFQVVFVEPDVRFPPRKMPPAEDQQFLPTHSPLSPLTPSSPLYPDGLIAPIWIRKHTTLVPSVFVLFKRIYEYQRPPGGTPLDVPDPDFDREREAEERRRDTELAQEIAQRKKSTNERSIKLTVVLMASRRMLDDPALDTRLTYIRRQSGLDPRAALFVLSPVAPSEIGDFVRSLQEALWEPASEYYTNHSKRVRRKRNRHTQGTSAYASSISPAGTVTTRPLRPEGWTVRYEYKMACFAEFRGEDEVALKHYQDAYSALQVMFGSTAILPPRTKRWAEARVLADSINFKICKLYLYNNEHSLALANQSMHMRKFGDLCRGWGIGEETFEFWGWVARQHRAFAELLEQGTRSTLKIPTYLPSSSSAASTVVSQPVDTQRSVVELESLRSLGLNPTQALQHPGFYYYMAARCTESRRARFLRFLENHSPENAASVPPSFENERKVDHLAIILELYTRSYELFKKYSPANAQSQGRQTLWIAYRIAQTYYESGKFDMAARFFERIAKTYRREKWDVMLAPLLSTWYKCAQQLGDMELGVQLLLEMLAHGTGATDDEPDAVQEDLLAVLQSTVPTSLDHPLVIDLADAEPLLDSSLVFWSSEVKVGEPAVFQLSLSATAQTFISSLPFSSLSIHFDEQTAPLTIVHKPCDDEAGLPTIQTVDLGRSNVGVGNADDAPREVEATLRWKPNGTIIFTGTLVSAIPATLTVSKLVLTLKEGSWWIQLPLQSVTARNGSAPTPRWLTSLDPPKFMPVRRDPSYPVSHVSVRPRPHSVRVTVSHRSPPYLGEEYPITVEVTNTDDRELDIAADAMLHPSEIEFAVISISADRELWTNLIKDVPFGTLAPGVSVVKTLYLQSAGAASEVVIDVSIRSRVPKNDVEPQIIPVSPRSPSFTPGDTCETLQTLVVQTVDPISVKHDVVYKRSIAARPGLADLATYEPEFGADGIKAEATISTAWTCVGPHGIKVEKAQLIKEDGLGARVVSCTLDTDSKELESEWLPGDEFSDCCRVAIGVLEGTTDDTIPGPGVYEIAWRKLLPNGEHGSPATSRFTLPPLKPPADELIALLDVPTQAQLHVPMQMRLTVRNLRQRGAANVVVQVEFDPSDGFVLAGLRSGRVPLLLPGGEEVLVWNMIPIECGYVRIPRIKVTDRRTPAGGADAQDQEGEVLSVVDVRWDARTGDGQERLRDGATDRKGGISDAVVLVLP